MLQLAVITSAVTLAAVGLSSGCDDARDRPAGEGVHPSGFAEEGSGVFHGDSLRTDGYPLAECSSCHGADFTGGDVGVSCTDAGCHESGVDDCAGTCHGDAVSPLPNSGGHQSHASFQPCADCHPIPSGLEDGAHLNGLVEVNLAGRAASGQRQPTWESTSRRCADVYCHLGDSPSWDEDAALGCDGCHDHQLAHARFARVVGTDNCGGCHAGSPAEGHIDGELVIGEPACNACHGNGPSGAPPVSLAGSSDVTTPGVGAHRRHLDPLIPGRIGKVVACRHCHSVPAAVLAPGHLGDAPAEVAFALGSYDPISLRCISSCHFDRDPGPSWTDASGAERACDACHGFPPTTTRIGTRHPPSEPQLAVCLGCHDYQIETHVDGEVNLR